MAWTKFDNTMPGGVNFPAIRFHRLRGNLSLNTHFLCEIDKSYSFVSLFLDTGEKKVALWFHKNQLAGSFKISHVVLQRSTPVKRGSTAVVSCRKITQDVSSLPSGWIRMKKADYLDDPKEKITGLWIGCWS